MASSCAIAKAGRYCYIYADEFLSVGTISSTDLIGMWQAPEGMDADDIVQELRRA